MLQSGTEGRRDGVSDKETYKALRSAMTTNAFSGKGTRKYLFRHGGCGIGK